MDKNAASMLQLVKRPSECEAGRRGGASDARAAVAERADGPGRRLVREAPDATAPRAAVGGAVEAIEAAEAVEGWVAEAAARLKPRAHRGTLQGWWSGYEWAHGCHNRDNA